MRDLKRRLALLSLVGALALVLFFTIFYIEKSGRKRTLIIGQKNDPEQQIVASMFKILIEERTHFKVQQSTLFGTYMIFSALKNGDVDLYCEYTGTALFNLLKEQPTIANRELYSYVKKRMTALHDLEVLEPLGFSNGYVIIMHEEEAKRLGIQTFSEWADAMRKRPSFKFACNSEFVSRPEMKMLKQGYLANTAFHPIHVDPSLSYLGIQTQSIASALAYRTDGRLVQKCFRVLEEDKELLPPYEIVPLVRGKLLREHPELREIFNVLSHSISTEEIVRLNAEVDINGKNLYKISRHWLIQHGLLEEKNAGSSG